MQFSNIVDAIRKALVPIHREGWPFIAAFFVGAIVLGWLVDALFWIGLALTAWCAYFFRDPERVTPVCDDFVISPADGVISGIGQAIPPVELDMGDTPLQRVSIFMNVFDVHINRAPVSGTVTRKAHKPGAFVSADLDKASQDNERSVLRIEGPRGALGVVQVAGLVARRILCWSREGDNLTAGERFGLIRFGSRVDIYMPSGATIAVALGQRAIAGETIVARYDDAPVAPVTRSG